jgi:hypothetical protein
MSGRHRTRAPKSNLLIGSIAASVGVSSVLAAAIIEMVSPEPSAATNDGAPRVAQDQPLTQEGRLVAVSSDSITARSADGMTRTYAITPNTAGITETSGNQTATTAASFAVNDRVIVVGTLKGGTAVATAITDKPAPAPMDYGV